MVALKSSACFPLFKPAVIAAINQAYLANSASASSPDVLTPQDVQQLSEAGYSCFCSRELELSNPAYSNAYAAFLALSGGSSTDPAAAIAALKTALVALMGPAGLCSSPCRAALAAVIEVEFRVLYGYTTTSGLSALSKLVSASSTLVPSPSTDSMRSAPPDCFMKP